MEQWRFFFSKAEEDVWTIIEQAILLAAHDHPGEFKQKRCDIAEILFAKRPRPEELDTTRLSLSGTTNCTLRTDLGEARDDEHASAACTNVQAVHDARKDGVEAHVCISTIVCDIKEALGDTMQPDGAVLCGLQKLESLHISVDVLKETEIGKQVNNLRKHPCKEIRLLAKSLVRHWKELVDDWVNRAGTSGHMTSERNHVKEERVSIKLEKDTPFSTDFPGESQLLFCSDAKGRESYLEPPEERGSSSRAELAGLGMVGRLEKPFFNSRGVANREHLEDESNKDAEELTGGKINNGKAIMLNRSYGGGKLSSDDSNASKCQGQKPTTNCEFGYYEGVHSEEKLDPTSKRKLPQGGLLQRENAKRQKLARPSN
ncbi:hypothetical protein GOP47_0008856 [Adiantum capillus-veneris]|uniref:TFIIS N-terminal domain-containing protein n=1 Tax=Adiantum capillus-veneris TaxID=13818 RepID=A0A9D4UZN7_ADICA|nr:hypothetical protein GOP47_0008856 [Adiantum capillus-veneris]